jgi:hypothetical protein
MANQNKFMDGPNGSQQTTRWLTPRWIVDALGDFDLDPCGAPGYELAGTTYNLEDGKDGLIDPWFGRVWLNPPYGTEAAAFMARMAEHNQGTALIFARTETKLFFDYVWDTATAILFIRSRIKFLTADQEVPKQPSGAPSVLIAYGKEDARKLWDSGIPGKLINLTK